MSHPLGKVDATLNKVAKEMTEAQIKMALELAEEYDVEAEAVLTCLAMNVQTMMLPKPR